MIRTYTMRLKVTRKQDEVLTQLLLQLGELYNMALEQRRDVWKSHSKSIHLYDQMQQLTELRAGVEEYAQGPLHIQRDPLRRVDRAFKAFFRRVKSGENPGYPRFKNTYHYKSFSVGKAHFCFERGSLRVPKLGRFCTKTRYHIKGKPLELRVKRCGHRWQAQVVCDIGPAPEKIAVHNAIGIDLGLTALVTLSNGMEILNPRWMRKEECHLSEAGRSLARKAKGSNNQTKSKEHLRRVHQRIAGLRAAYITAKAKQLVANYDLIAHEKLNIRGMVRSNLAKGIMDAAWGQLIWRIQCEAEKAGKWVIPVNPRNTTIICSRCGERVPKTLAQRQHECPKCGLSLGRDHNAARNVLRLGESLVARQNTRCSN